MQASGRNSIKHQTLCDGERHCIFKHVNIKNRERERVKNKIQPYR
jgi:hypothetical protein